MNPRYLAYAKATGIPNPDERLALDEVKYPGGKMAGYQIWIGAQWSEWIRARGRKSYDILTREDHEDFDRFIGAASPTPSGGSELPEGGK